MSSTNTPIFPVFVNPSGMAPPANFGLGGSIKNMKSCLKVSLTSTLPSGYAIVSSNVTIDKWLKTTNYASTTDVSWYFTNGNAKFIVGPNNSPADVVYNYFLTGISYKILFQVNVQDNNNNVTMYQSVYQFNYLNPAPTLSNFTFNANIASGDNIYISGLILENPSPFAGDTPVSVSFQFNELELVNDNINNEINEKYIPLSNYDPSGNYTLTNNTLQNDNFYQITATAVWATGYSTSINSSQDLFVIARPSIQSVVTYDAQNDGGNDGVSYVDASGNFVDDANDQVIATIALSPVGYNNYLPSQVKFIFYDMSNDEIGSSNQTYNATSNSLQTYNIKLNSVTLVNSSVYLLDGMPGYTVKAQVSIPIVIDSVSYPNQIRNSDTQPVVFRQGVAPILPLTIGNSWDLVSNGNPSSAAELYTLSPIIGIFGYFSKNAQFMSVYSKNLDKTSTKFLLQYTLKVNGVVQPLVNVVSAALVQPGSQETKEQAMIRAIGSVVNSPNGQYTNVVGPSGVVGTDQKPLVFYIHHVQGDVTFKESDEVNFHVTIVDSSNQWTDPSYISVTNTSSSVSAVKGVIMVNKIPTYSYTSAEKGQTVEPFIDNVYSNSTVMKALLDNELIQVKKSDVIADSANIITQTANGWNVVNPAAVNGVVPKVNLYNYRNPSYLPRAYSSAPWTSANKQQNASNSFTMDQIDNSNDLGMWWVINQNAGARQYPFFVAYTCPTDPTDTPSSSNKAFWYKSKIFYAPSSGDPTQSGLTLFYTGTDNGLTETTIPAGRRVKLVVNAGLSNQNTDVSSEYVSLVSIQTSSNAASTNAGDFNFLLRTAGITTTSLLHGKYHIPFTDSSLIMIDNLLSLVNDDSTIISDSANIITKSNKGWTVVNPAAVNNKVPKVNLYYYTMSASTSFTMGRVNESSDLGMWYIINQNAGAKQYPFLIAYTQPTASGNAASWYKSKIFYGPSVSIGNPTPDPTRSGFTLLYTGTDNVSLYPEIPADRRVKLAVNANLSLPVAPNANLSSESVMTVSIHTSSNAAETVAGDFNFSLVYAGVVTSGTSFSNINTFFANPLLKLNIPLNNETSIYLNDATIFSTNTPTVSVVVKNVASIYLDQSVAEQPLSPPVVGWYLGMPMLPLLTNNKYTVQYSIKNPNNNNADLKGLVSDTSTISTLNEPQLTDFTVSNFSIGNANNNNGETSITFDLSIQPYALDRIDGVHAYIISDSNSNIPLTKIGTFKANQVARKIVLLSNNSDTLAFGSNLTWTPLTTATITFVAFRDKRVDSAVDETDNPFATWTAPSISNIPGVDRPSLSGPITLTGGIINSSNNTVLNWVNDTSAAYSYTLTMTKGNATPVNVQYTTNANTASAILAIDTDSTTAYTLALRKVFIGESSPVDIITFNSVKVETSGMVVSVLNPSNVGIITVSWVAPDITGSGTSFENNVASLCLSDNGTRINSSSSAPTFETSGGNYSISNTVGFTLQLRMKVTANVMYSVNSGALSKSSPVSVPLGYTTSYTVSTIPNVSLSSATSTVLIQNTTTPSLLLNLNAMGLEAEGIISLVVVLTQDGTSSKPEGCEVLLQFPQAPNATYLNSLINVPSNNNFNQFVFPNIVGSAGSGNANLVGGESSSVAPLNLVPTGLSNNVGNYTLTIGSVNTSGANIGRYSLSSLTFPANSGFVNGQDSNIMAILTTRRGTDIMVGSFNFAAPPVASNVTITTTNGQYYVNFNLD
jgi:hypothetical protein